MEKKYAIGLIAEFNPFHKGHEIFIKNAKSLNKDAILICVMSPNYVQRGEVAIYPKDKRVLDALNNDIDLVIELPTICAVESAPYFASSALKILNTLKVDEIIFGTESGNTNEFIKKYDNGDFGNPRMDEIIEDYMDKGYSYASAKSYALKLISNFYLDSPNDILGYEYLKYIRTNNLDIKVNAYQRINDEKDPNGTSAFAIREKLKKHRKNRYNFAFLDDYFSLIKYKIINSTLEELQSIHLVEEGIEYLFKKKIEYANNLDEFIDSCTSKRYSHARIKRTLIHILLNTKKEEAKQALESNPYIRVLGFNSRGSEYLKYMKKEYDLRPVIRFSAQDDPLLLYELNATRIYALTKDIKVQNELIKKEKSLFPIKK